MEGNIDQYNSGSLMQSLSVLFDKLIEENNEL